MHAHGRRRAARPGDRLRRARARDRRADAGERLVATGRPVPAAGAAQPAGADSRPPCAKRSRAARDRLRSRSSSPTPTAAPAAGSTRCCAEEGVERIAGAHCYEFFADGRGVRRAGRRRARHVLPDRLPGPALRPAGHRGPRPRPASGTAAATTSATTAGWSTWCSTETRALSAQARAAAAERLGLAYEERLHGLRRAGDRSRRRRRPSRATRHLGEDCMASLIVISWRDVPAQVIVKRGRETAKVQLSQRFQEAIDRAAMRAGRGSSDAYLEDWRRAEPARLRRRPARPRPQRAAAAIEARYSDDDLERLIRAKGIDVTPAPSRSARRRAPATPDVRRPPLVGPPCARPGDASTSGFERVLVAAAPAARSASATQRLERPVAAVERGVKGLLFDCRMCGQCVLSSTGMSCPMNCPKQLRNGPCGGVRANGNCEVKPEMRCVWVEAWRGAERMPGRHSMRSSSCSRRSTSASRAARPGCGSCARRRGVAAVKFEDEPVPGYPAADPARATPRPGGSSACCARARSPSPPSSHPPDSADPDDVYERAARASTATSTRSTPPTAAAPTATCRASAVCALLTRVGYAPVMQISCRDKNRIAIQGDILGGAAMGVCNMLCLTGDGVQAGDHPQAKPVFDLDSHLAARHRARPARRASLPERPQDHATPPRVFLGAAENPFVPPLEYRAVRLAKKIAAGAQFVQTQYCYDVPLLRRFMTRGRATPGCSTRCFILVGVGPLRSAKAGEWMRTHVPGVHIPDAVIDAPRRARRTRRARACNLCVDLIQEIRDDRGRGRRARHGLPPGRIRRRGHRAIGRARRARAVVPGPRHSRSTQTGRLHDRYRHQLGDPRSRHRLRPPVRHHRRAHQPDRAQAARRRDGGRRLQPRRGGRARAGRGRRAHARRQRRHPARRRAGDPGAGHPAGAVDHRRAAVDRLARSSPRSRPGLAVYKGKALVNSVTGEEERLETVLPLVKKYGAAVVAISNDETGISEDPDVRFEVAKKIVAPRDGPRHPAHATSWSTRWSCRSARSTRPACRSCGWCTRLREELKVNTTCGASNISFGLPHARRHQQRRS